MLEALIRIIYLAAGRLVATTPAWCRSIAAWVGSKTCFHSIETIRQLSKAVLFAWINSNVD